jgi:hypothetical protein
MAHPLPVLLKSPPLFAEKVRIGPLAAIPGILPAETRTPVPMLLILCSLLQNR